MYPTLSLHLGLAQVFPCTEEGHVGLNPKLLSPNHSLGRCLNPGDCECASGILSERPAGSGCPQLNFPE